MIALCHPYSPEITCLCDEISTVLRCFITRYEQSEEDTILGQHAGGHSDPDALLGHHAGGNPRHRKNSINTVYCNKMMDTRTEVLLAGTILIVIACICIWYYTM